MFVKSSLPPGPTRASSAAAKACGVVVVVGVDAADAVADRQLAKKLIVGQRPHVAAGGIEQKILAGAGPRHAGSLGMPGQIDAQRHARPARRATGCEWPRSANSGRLKMLARSASSAPNTRFRWQTIFQGMSRFRNRCHCSPKRPPGRIGMRGPAGHVDQQRPLGEIADTRSRCSSGLPGNR